jgi:hypothetical protein
MAVRRYRCINGHEWDVSYEAVLKEPPRFCLTCKTQSIVPLWPGDQGWSKTTNGGSRRLRRTNK